MDEAADRLDGLLKEALGPAECRSDLADDAEPEEINVSLYRSVLDSAEKRSSELLASAIVEGASLRDWNVDDLAEEAGSERDVARRFLTQGGDPRGLRAGVMARLLWQAGIDPRGVLELMRQAVVSYAKYSKPETGMTWARTARLSGEERTRALESESLARDPARAAKDARLYSDDVLSAWQELEAKSR